MKNYLGNLIARHMSQAEVLLPRHASRFEPQSSVLQSDEFQGETAVMDGAGTFGGEPDVVAPVSPIPPEIEHRVANPSLPLPHSPAESVVESSGPVPVPTFAVANDRHYALTLTPASSDRVASTNPVQIDDLSGSESRSVSRADFAAPTASEAAIDSRWTKTTDQIALHDHVAERTPRESGPSTQPFTPNEPLAANESFTINEQVTETEGVTPSRRAAPEKSIQPPTLQSVETQSPVSKPTMETTKTAETGREPVARVTKSEPFATANKSEPFATTTKNEPFASGTTSERFTLTVPHSEDGDISVGLPKSQQPNPPVAIEHSSRERSWIEQSSRELLSAVVVPERTENSPLINAASESQAALKQPESLPEEARLPQVAQRVRQLETSVARPPVNDPGNVINPGNTRLTPHNDITPAETGPTINVTIGRIEVRAATSEPRPQKQRREQQVLSLDEYLNQRSAGGR